jgi:hypothetical protein
MKVKASMSDYDASITKYLNPRLRFITPPEKPKDNDDDRHSGKA